MQIKIKLPNDTPDSNHAIGFEVDHKVAAVIST